MAATSFPKTIFKGMGRVGERMLAVSPGEIAIPAVVLYELEVGIGQTTQSAKRRKQLDALVDVITVLPFHAVAAKRAAEITVALRKTGMSIGPMDTLIAATALSHNATLITHNTKEFQRVRGLTLADWY